MNGRVLVALEGGAVKAAVKARPPTQPERVLAMLRSGPQSTLDIRANYIMAAGYVIFKLRTEGHRIDRTRLPNGVALYTLIAKAS